MSKNIKIFLLIGMAIFTCIIGRIAWPYFDGGFANKSKVETWNNRIVEFENEQDKTHQEEKLDNVKKCRLESRKVVLPIIREEIGDTINIKRVYDWQLNSERTAVDIELSQVVNRKGKFFQLNQTENNLIVGFLEDEGEYLGIYAYSIDKKNCKIIGTELLAETTAWEFGYKETFSIIKDDNQIKREKKTGSKDWGDRTKWKRDTIITMITFDKMGKINLKIKS